MSYFGTSITYLCTSETQKACIMKNTDYNYNVLGSIISSEDSLAALLEMIEDMDLEITGVRQS